MAPVTFMVGGVEVDPNGRAIGKKVLDPVQTAATNQVDVLNSTPTAPVTDRGTIAEQAMNSYPDEVEDPETTQEQRDLAIQAHQDELRKQAEADAAAAAAAEAAKKK